MSSQQEPWQSDPQLAQLLKLSTWTAAQAEQMLQIQRIRPPIPISPRPRNRANKARWI
jgi:hypothetical protein